MAKKLYPTSIQPLDGGVSVQLSVESLKPALSNLYPTPIQLETSKIPNEISPLSNSSNYNDITDTAGVKLQIGAPKNVNRAPGATIGKKLDRSDRAAQIHLPVKSRYVALNESGTQRIGEDHPRAKLSDAQVEAMRDDYEAGLDGSGPRIGYRLLAKKYKVSKRTVRNIVHYEKRNQWADRWKKVKG